MIAVVTAVILALDTVLPSPMLASPAGRCLFWRSSASFRPRMLRSRSSTARSPDRSARQILPGLELRDGVPPDLRTIIVVPTLLAGAVGDRRADRTAGGSSSFQPGRQFHFRAALRLAGLRDASMRRRRDASEPGSRRHCAAERALRAGAEGTRFFLLHRRRIWNEGEGKWIGWERKRGKLHELNRLLRGATDTTFHADRRPCCPSLPAGIRYVITLDADTRLPIGAARRLVGKMAHPLNRPRLRSACRLRRAGPRHAAAARDAVAAHRQRGLAVPARLFRPQRARSLCARGFRRLSGPVRGRLLLRQGNLRSRQLRGGARRANSRKHGPQPRSAGRHLRARGARLRYRGRRGISLPLRVSPRPASIAGCGATGSCCPGFSAFGDKAQRRLRRKRRSR